MAASAAYQLAFSRQRAALRKAAYHYQASRRIGCCIGKNDGSRLAWRTGGHFIAHLGISRRGDRALAVFKTSPAAAAAAAAARVMPSAAG